MSDVSLVKPIFHGGALVAFSATTAHMPDIGGRVRAIEARELFEEGLHIPLTELGDELFARSERAMRAAIRSVPDGTYRYAFQTDGFEQPYRFQIALTVRGEEIIADYTGTSPAQPRAINCVFAYTYAMTAYAVRCALLPSLANNEGMYRPVKVTAPEGSLLNPRFPAAVVSRATTGHYVPVLVLGALHPVIPDR